MRIRAVRGLVAAFILGWACIAGAQLAVPSLTGRVVDQAATLTGDAFASVLMVRNVV